MLAMVEWFEYLGYTVITLMLPHFITLLLYLFHITHTGIFISDYEFYWEGNSLRANQVTSSQ